MNDRVEFALPSKDINPLPIPDVTFLDAHVPPKPCNVRTLDGGVVVVVKIVNQRNIVPVCEQTGADVRADKSGAAGHQYLHACRLACEGKLRQGISGAGGGFAGA